MENLSRVLARLYPTESSLQRIAGDAGIDYARVTGANMLDKWASALREAQTSGVLGEVVGAALREYPVYAPLQQAAMVDGVMLRPGLDASGEQRLNQLAAVVDQHENRIKIMWDKLHPTPRRRVGDAVAIAVVSLLVVSWVIPESARWYSANPWAAFAVLVATIVLALLARWLPE